MLYLLFNVLIQGRRSDETPLLQPGRGFGKFAHLCFVSVCVFRLMEVRSEVRVEGHYLQPEMCLCFLLFSQLTSCSLTAWKTTGGTSWRPLAGTPSAAGARVRAHATLRQGTSRGSRMCPPSRSAVGDQGGSWNHLVSSRTT